MTEPLTDEEFNGRTGFVLAKAGVTEEEWGAYCRYIDALRARVAELEQEVRAYQTSVVGVTKRAEKAEAERDKFERELLENGDWSGALARIRAETRAATLEEAATYAERFYPPTLNAEDIRALGDGGDHEPS